MKQENIRFLPARIVSGGQTGVDRAALDFAISHGISHGGWCPAGRVAEDGPISEIYRLQETSTAVYSERTIRNVEDSSATLILYHRKLAGGTKLTMETARRLNRPFLLVDLHTADQYGDEQRVRIWLNDLRPPVLNIAGPRESGNPGIYQRARNLLDKVFSGRP
jgi:Circularly permutated YpsA SLOG family